MFKYQILNEFIDIHKDLPEQGTDAWKQLRRSFIGGSEVASILKQNKNKSTNKLVLEKLGFDRFKGNVITHWGNVFEELIRLHCEDEFNCTIKETGSIPYKHGSLSYSPDGVSVIPTKRIVSKFNNAEEFIDVKSASQLVLFEFKCPHSRLPTFEIPEHYFPQVSIGMNIIDIMETAIFVQGTFRRCLFEQIEYSTKHNPYGHFKQADVRSNPIECGFMLVYGNDKDVDYIDSLKEQMVEVGGANLVEHSDISVVDIGSLFDQSLLEEVMGHCVSKTFKIDYSFRYPYDQSIFKKDAYSKGMYNQSLQYKSLRCLSLVSKKYKNIIGIIPYKLLNVFMTQVKKNKHYIQETKAHDKAQTVLQCIDELRDEDDMSKVKKLIRAYKL